LSCQKASKRKYFSTGKQRRGKFCKLLLQLETLIWLDKPSLALSKPRPRRRVAQVSLVKMRRSVIRRASWASGLPGRRASPRRARMISRSFGKPKEPKSIDKDSKERTEKSKTRSYIRNRHYYLN